MTNTVLDRCKINSKPDKNKGTKERKRIEILLGAIQYLSKYIENLSAQTDLLRQLLKTSRERPKSAPYLSSKIAKGLQSVKYSLLQYPLEEKLEKKSELFKFFFEIFLVSGKSHSAETCKRGTPGVFEHPCFAKSTKK